MKINNIKKMFPIALMTLGALVPFGTAWATEGWGPQDRPTYTWEKPADHITFNSIKDNPEIGNETNFVRVKEADTEDKYSDNVDLKVGKEYEVFIYYHNNAAANLNLVTSDVRITTGFPDNKRLSKGDVAVVKGAITSPDSNPKQVFDEAYLHVNDDAVYLRYVKGSATIYNHGKLNGAKLADSLFDSNHGAYLGFDEWGKVPGCNHYAGYVTYRIKVDQPGFHMEKTASKNLANSYGERITAKPGETIDFKILYKNTGTTDQKSVTVYDKMPEGMKYVPGTTFVKTPRNGNGEFVSDKLFDGGLVVGDYRGGEWVEITYKAVIEDNKSLFPCNTTKKILNNSSVATANGTEYDSVEVTVSRDCNEEEKDDCYNEDGSLKNIPECNSCLNEDGTVKDTPECKPTTPTPETPKEIPSTGPTEIVFSLLVITGLGISIAYWYRSQRELTKIQKKL